MCMSYWSQLIPRFDCVGAGAVESHGVKGGNAWEIHISQVSSGVGSVCYLGGWCAEHGDIEDTFVESSHAFIL